MLETLAEQIIQKLEQTADLYYRLIIIVTPSGGGKTPALRKVHEQIEAPIINVNLELSRRMLDLTERQRSVQAQKIFEEIVNESQGDIVLLDNIEILFDPALKQDPLRLLQRISRNRTLIVAWNGTCNSTHFTYASPEHGEFKRYPIGDLILISPGHSLDSQEERAISINNSDGEKEQ
jgi:hypothetical protein